MGSIGFGELLLIFVIGYLIIGPEKFPGFLRKIGKEISKIVKIKDDLEESFIQKNLNEKEEDNNTSEEIIK